MPAQDSRWDPEMLAFSTMMEQRAAAQPPIVLTPPLDEARKLNDGPQLDLAQGGPTMAESGDRWLPIRGRRLLCRFHRPAGGTLPVLIYIHGGGWVWGSVDTHDRLMREYAAAAGCAVIGPDYALSPEAAFPQGLEECAAVVRWVARHGAEWGLDPARIVIGGDSAGANLAMGVALLLRETDPDIRLSGLLLNYGVFDSRLDTATYREFAEGYFLTREKMRFYWECYCPRPADRLSPLAAPLRADLRGIPPVLLHIAELDVLAAENHAMAERLRASGVAVESRLSPGTAHGFLRALAYVGASRQAAADGGAWLARRFA
ncbi:carboxylesterase [Falsiroseomonas bella]|uniref:Carboxylesterase n=1 Tax=Falsiroseomonas bella TaxID=2184016 RepID=A0A317F6A6_9PROT|nr:alpha/beta hydrolase [Falsiroseomonas bella]PWS34072.1 carboxylesterase [Falsiroseomonas bella]